jgi:flagellar biosynthetic protein FlhB
VEIIENKPLARSLNKMTEIGDQVPVELYQAVAEILAKIFQNRN